ncbi:hypothetical protein Tco_0562205 [Tanacetum coccineum]
MAKNMFLSDGSLQSGDVFSTFAQIPSIVDTGKEPIQARSQLVQSTAPKEPIQSQSNLMPRRLKRVKALKYITLSVDEKGRDIITYCPQLLHETWLVSTNPIPGSNWVSIPRRKDFIRKPIVRRRNSCSDGLGALKVSADKPVRAGLHSQANGQAELLMERCMVTL